ncbi:TPA: hypothetical protein ACXM5B_003886 [Proteus mirabilis]
MSGIAGCLFPHSRVSQQLKNVANDARMLKITAEELNAIRLDDKRMCQSGDYRDLPYIEFDLYTTAFRFGALIYYGLENRCPAFLLHRLTDMASQIDPEIWDEAWRLGYRCCLNAEQNP